MSLAVKGKQIVCGGGLVRKIDQHEEGTK
jgi:hypothetical protein